MNQYVGILKTKTFLFTAGILIGALIILTIRFVNYKPENQIHYHANFAVFINGEREQFKGMQYYEETEASSCTVEHVDSPLERAHMHGNVNDVVHIEDDLVTWGHFMQNLGWGMGDDYIKTAENIYSNNKQGKVVFVLNGEQVDKVSDRIIQDKDKLLISYGEATNDELQNEYKMIPETAIQYNTSQDPAGCGANKKIKATDKLRHLF